MPGSPSPFAVIVVGTAGSGKSTVARDLARRTGAAYLDKDALAGPLVEAAMSSRGESTGERESNAFYRDVLMPAEYEALFAVARSNLDLGLPVVIDAPFAAYLDQESYLGDALALWPAVRLFVVSVRASEEATRRRLTARALPRDEAKLAHWDEFWPRWGSVSVSWPHVPVIVIDNEHDPDLDGAVLRLLGAA